MTTELLDLEEMTEEDAIETAERLSNSSAEQSKLEILEDESPLDKFEREFKKGLENVDPLMGNYYRHKRIKQSWNKAVEGVFEVGFLFHNAKEHCENLHSAEIKSTKTNKYWERFIKESHFTERTITRLIKIYRDPKLKANVRLLPSSWGTLIELSSLSEEQFNKAIEDKMIHPGMLRQDALKLKKSGKKENEENEENDLYKGKIRSLIVYFDSLDDADLVEKAEKALRKLSTKIEVDSSPFEKAGIAGQKKTETDYEKSMKRGRREAIKCIRGYKVMKEALYGKKFKEVCPEIHEFFLEDYYKQFIDDPINSAGENEIDSMLQVCGETKTCEQFEQDAFNCNKP
ncbi:hypothetical protein FCL47_12920 [Desulfopila sp. IMCC35006]|uniref:hypothetical protein n=1 Tax=Desulfopila sp. IMCC35006 TaxID=2569542 RepID=UPI0010AD10BB|nr:hypothetical protein [Desulfopila sp. IMCC35006]TKB25981.1 hypothetical protein FCL47_12920 [Desulfopila sp. IMCC35006]